MKLLGKLPARSVHLKLKKKTQNLFKVSAKEHFKAKTV